MYDLVAIVCMRLFFLHCDNVHSVSWLNNILKTERWWADRFIVQEVEVRWYEQFHEQQQNCATECSLKQAFYTMHALDCFRSHSLCAEDIFDSCRQNKLLTHVTDMHVSLHSTSTATYKMYPAWIWSILCGNCSRIRCSDVAETLYERLVTHSGTRAAWRITSIWCDNISDPVSHLQEDFRLVNVLRLWAFFAIVFMARV